MTNATNQRFCFVVLFGELVLNFTNTPPDGCALLRPVESTFWPWSTWSGASIPPGLSLDVTWRRKTFDLTSATVWCVCLAYTQGRPQTSEPRLCPSPTAFPPWTPHHSQRCCPGSLAAHLFPPVFLKRNHLSDVRHKLSLKRLFHKAIALIFPDQWVFHVNCTLKSPLEAASGAPVPWMWARWGCTQQFCRARGAQVHLPGNPPLCCFLSVS